MTLNERNRLRCRSVCVVSVFAKRLFRKREVLRPLEASGTR